MLTVRSRHSPFPPMAGPGRRRGARQPVWSSPGRSTHRSPSRSWSRQLCQWWPSHALLNKTSTPRSRKKLASARFSSASPSSSPVETKARVPRQRRRAPERPHQPRDAVEDRVRPPRELALVEDEGARLQHQPAEARRDSGRRSTSEATAPRLAPSSTRSAGALGDAPARRERRQQLAAPGSAACRRPPEYSPMPVAGLHQRRDHRRDVRRPRSGCRAPPAGRHRSTKSSPSWMTTSG